MQLIKSLIVLATLFFSAAFAQNAPSIRLGGAVVDGEIGFWQFFQSSDGVSIKVTACNALIVDPIVVDDDYAGDACDLTHANGAEDVDGDIADFDTLAWTGSDNLAQNLFRDAMDGATLGCGDNPTFHTVGQSDDVGSMTLTYKPLIQEVGALTSDTTMTFTLDTDFFGDGYGSSADTAPSATLVVKKGLGKVSADVEQCELSLNDGDYELLRLLHGDMVFDVTSKFAGLFKKSAALGNMLTSADSTLAQFDVTAADVRVSTFGYSDASVIDQVGDVVSLYSDLPTALVCESGEFFLVDALEQDSTTYAASLTTRPAAPALSTSCVFTDPTITEVDGGDGVFAENAHSVDDFVVAIPLSDDDDAECTDATAMWDIVSDSSPLTFHHDISANVVEDCTYQTVAYDTTEITADVSAFTAGDSIEFTDLDVDIPAGTFLAIRTDSGDGSNACTLFAQTCEGLNEATEGTTTVSFCGGAIATGGDGADCAVTETTPAYTAYIVHIDDAMGFGADIRIPPNEDAVIKASTLAERISFDVTASSTGTTNPLDNTLSCTSQKILQPFCYPLIQLGDPNSDLSDLDEFRTEPEDAALSLYFSVRVEFTDYDADDDDWTMAFQYSDYEEQRLAAVSVTTTETTPSSTDWDSVVAPNMISGWIPWDDSNYQPIYLGVDLVDQLVYDGDTLGLVSHQVEADGEVTFYTDNGSFSTSDEDEPNNVYIFAMDSGKATADYSEDADGDAVPVVDAAALDTFAYTSTSGLAEGSIVVAKNLLSATDQTCGIHGDAASTFGLYRISSIDTSAKTITFFEDVFDGECIVPEDESVELSEIKTTSIAVEAADDFDGTVPHIAFSTSANQLFPYEHVFIDCQVADAYEAGLYEVSDGTYDGEVDGKTILLNLQEGTGIAGDCTGANLNIDLLHPTLASWGVIAYGTRDAGAWFDQTPDLVVSFSGDDILGSNSDVTCTGQAIYDELDLENGEFAFIDINGDDAEISSFYPEVWNCYLGLAITESKFMSGSDLYAYIFPTHEFVGWDADEETTICDNVLSAMSSDPSNSDFTAVLAHDDTTCILNAPGNGPWGGENGDAIEIEFGAELAASDFDIDEILTITTKIDLDSAGMLDASSDPPLSASYAVANELLIYPDGLLDHHANVAMGEDSSHGFLFWDFGAHMHEIAYSAVRCEDTLAYLHVAVPASAPSIEVAANKFVAATGPSDLAQYHWGYRGFNGGNCRIETSDVFGNKISSIVESDDFFPADQGYKPEKILHVTLDSDDHSEWMELGAGFAASADNTVTVAASVPIPAGAVVAVDIDGAHDTIYGVVTGTDGYTITDDEVTVTLTDLSDDWPSVTDDCTAIVDDCTDVRMFEGLSQAKLAAGNTYSPFLEGPKRWFSVASVNDGEEDANDAALEAYTDDWDAVGDGAGSGLFWDSSSGLAVHPKSLGGTNKGKAGTLTGLVYGKSYRIQSIVRDQSYDELEADIIGAHEAVPFIYTHVFSAPAPAGVPYTESAGSSSLTIHWAPPPGNGGFPVTKYDLQCTAQDVNDWDGWDGNLDEFASKSDITETDALGRVIPRATVTGLTPETKYTCRVVSYTAYGMSYGYVNGFQPNHRRYDADSACDAITFSSLSGLGQNLSPGDPFWRLSIPCLSDSSVHVGRFYPVEFEGHYRYHISSLEERAGYNEGVLDVPIDMSEVMPDRTLAGDEWNDVYGHSTTHIFTTASSTSLASAPHPLSNVDLQREFDGADFKLTASWSTTSEGSKGEEVEKFAVHVTYPEGGDWTTEFFACVAASENELIICNSGSTDEDCDVTLGAGIETSSFVGVKIYAFAKNGGVSQPQEAWVYIQGPESEDDDVIGSCPEDPPSGYHYQWFTGWDLGAFYDNHDEDEPANLYHFDDSSNVAPAYYFETNFASQTFEYSDNSESVTFWVTDLTATIIDDVSSFEGVRYDPDGGAESLGWSVLDVNRDAAFIEIDVPCAWTQTSTVPVTKLEILLDGAAGDDFESDFLDYSFEWEDGYDYSEESIVFTPTGLESTPAGGDPVTYDSAEIVAYTENLTDGLTIADSLEPFDTLSWKKMWPLMTLAPVVTPDADDSSSLTVTWTHPASDGGSPVRYYQLAHRSHTSSFSVLEFSEDDDQFDVDFETTNEELTFTVTGLLAGQNYWFKVRSCNRQVFAVEDAAEDVFPRCSKWSQAGVAMTTAPTTSEAADVSIAAADTAAVVTVTTADSSSSTVVYGSIRCLEDRLDGGGSSFSVHGQAVGITENVGNWDADAELYLLDPEESVFRIQLSDLTEETKYNCAVETVDTYGLRAVAEKSFTTAAADDAEPLAPFHVDYAEGVASFTVPDGASIDTCTWEVFEASGVDNCGSKSTIADTEEEANVAGDEVTATIDDAVLMAVLDTEEASDTYNLGFCFYAMCSNADGDGKPSHGVYFESEYAAPENDVEVEIVDFNDRAALVQLTAPSSTNGEDVTSYYVHCENDDDADDEISNTFAIADFKLEQDEETYILQAHLSGFTPASDYTCYAAADNGKTAVEAATAIADLPSGTPETSFTTADDTEGVDGVRLYPLAPRSPWISSDGVVAEYEDGTTLAREPVTHQSVRLEWETLCATAGDASDCTGWSSGPFTDDATAGTEDAQYIRAAGSDVGTPFGASVEIIATVLRMREEGEDYVYKWYNDESTGTADDELNDLKGGTTYEFSVASVSNLLSLLRDGTLEDLHFSPATVVTTAAASAPDTPPAVTVDDGGDGWHTRSAVFIDLAEYGDGYDLISPNGSPVTKFSFECRPEDTTTWDTLLIKKGSVEAPTKMAAPTSGTVVGLDPSDSTTTYECRARAESEAGMSGWSNTYNDNGTPTHDEETGPVRMHAPYVEEKGADSVTLSWLPASDNDGSAVVGYIISEAGGDMLEVEDGEASEAEFTGLDAYTDYSFTVQAYNSRYLVCNPDDDGNPGLSVASKPVEVTTTATDTSLGNKGAIVLPDSIEVTPGQTVAMFTWDGEIDIVSDSAASARVDVEIAEVGADADNADALDWASVDGGNDNMWDAGALKAGWAARPWRYATGLTAETEYVLRFVGHTIPVNALGDDAVVMTSYAALAEFTTEADAQPMPPLPVTQNGLNYVDESVEIDTPQNEEGGDNVRYIHFDFSTTYGYPSPEVGDEATGTDTAGYLVETSDGDAVANPSTTVETDATDGHWSKTVEDDDGDEVVVSDLTSLKADTEYAFSVRYQDTAGNKGEVFEDFVVQTSSCGRIDEVRNVALVSDSAVASGAALLQWSEPKTHGSALTGYTIECFDNEELDGTAVSTDVPLPWTTWYVEGLDAGTDYFCRVQASAEEDNCSSAEGDATLEFTTLSVTPVAPLKHLSPYLAECESSEDGFGYPFVSVSELEFASQKPTTQSLQVSWPQDTASDDLWGSTTTQATYDFQWKMADADEFVSLNDVEGVIDVTGIAAGVEYEFRVRAVQRDAVGEWSELYVYPEPDEDEEETISATAPNYPSSVVVHDQTRAAVLVTWAISDNGGSPVESVDIECKRGAAVGDDSDEYPYFTTVHHGTNGHVQLVEDNIRAPSVDDAEAFDLDADEDEFVYYCRLRATNEVGSSQWSAAIGASSELPTEQGFPLAPARPQIVGSAGVDEITVRFYTSGDMDGTPVLGYTLYAEADGAVFAEEEVDPEDFEEYDDMDGMDDMDDMDGEDMGDHFAADSYVMTFTGLSASTEYTFYSTATNRHKYENPTDGDDYVGASTASPTLVKKTIAASRPEPATGVNFVDVLATQAGFEWEMPYDNGSPVEQVVLRCSLAQLDEEAVDADDAAVRVELSAEHQQPFRSGYVEAEVCSTAAECAEEWRSVFAIDGLDDEDDFGERVYYCALGVSNSVGLTYSAEYYRVEMDVEAEIDQLPAFEKPTASDVEATSLTISWTAAFGGDLTFDVTGSSNAGQVLGTTDEEHLFTGLTPNTEYTFTVTTVDGAATTNGEYADRVTVSTAAGEPLAPSSLVVEDRNAFGALISWAAATSRGSEVTSYTIVCTDADENEVESTTDIYEDAEGRLYGHVFELDADVSYDCGVQATNEVGTSDISSKTVDVGAHDPEDHGTLPLMSLPPVVDDSEGEEEDPHTFDSGHITSPTEIKIKFGQEIDASNFVEESFVGLDGAVVQGYWIKWGKVDHEDGDGDDDVDDAGDMDGDDDGMEELFLTAGEAFDEEDRFYVFTGLEGGSEYQFQVRSFTQGEDNQRHLASAYSAPLVVETADYSRQDVPDLPEELDVSMDVLLVAVHGHDNGSPTDSENRYHVMCRPAEEGAEYTAEGWGDEPSVYVRRPAGSDEKEWRCKAQITNVREHGKSGNKKEVESGWSYDSWVITLDTDKAPLQPLAPTQIDADFASVEVEFSVPPFAGGSLTPNIHTLGLYYIAVGDYDDGEDVATNLEDNADSFSVDERELAEWCDDDEKCMEDVLDLEKRSNVVFHAEIEDLSANTEYYVFLYAKAGTATVLTSPYSEFLTAKTQPGDRPDDVEGLTVIDSHDSAFLFQWDAPATNGAAVSEFNVQCASPSFDDEDVTLVSSAYTVPEDYQDDDTFEWASDTLEADDSTWECRVQATNIYGTSNGHIHSFELGEASDMPLRLVAPTLNADEDAIAPDDENGFTVRLDVAEGPDASDLEQFEVTYRFAYTEDAEYAEDDVQTVDSGSTIEVTSLLADSAYRFRVAANKVVGEENGPFAGPSSESKTVETGAGQPSAPKKVTVNIVAAGDDIEEVDCEETKSKVCDLGKGPLKSKGNGIKNCEATCSAASVFIEVTLTAADAGDATFAEDIAALSTDEAIAEATGLDVAVEVEVPDTQVVSLTNDAVFLTWPAYEDNGSELTSYTIVCTTADEEGEFTFADDLTVQNDVTPVGGDLENGGFVSGLAANTTYVCRVDATNALGTFVGEEADYSGDFTTPLLGDIRKPLRVPRPTITDVTEDTAVVNWLVPESLGGILEDDTPYEDLTGYTIRYEISSQTDAPVEIQADAEAVSVEVSSLKRGQTYSFTVAADNSIEEGDVVFSANVETTLSYATPAAPTVAASVPVDATTASVTLYGRDDDGIRIDGGLPLDRYLVQVAPAPAEGETFDDEVADIDWDILPEEWDVPLDTVSVYPIQVEIGGTRVNTVRTFTLTGLDSNSANGYVLRYAAVNELGVGEYSDVTVVRTEFQPPDAPTNVVVAANGDEALTVTFTTPERDGGADIESYTVTLEETAGPVLGTQSDTFAVGSNELADNGDGSWTVSFAADGPNQKVFRGATYSATVTAKNSEGNSESSAAGEGSVDAGLPYSPVGFTATTSIEATDGNTTTWQITGAVQLGWNGGSDYTEVVFSATDATSGDSVTVIDDTIVNNEASFTAGGLSADTTYDLVATITNGFGSISVEDSVVTQATTGSGSTGTGSTGTGSGTGSTGTGSSISIITPASTSAPQMLVVLCVMAMALLF